MTLSKPPRGFLTPRWATEALLPHVEHLVNGLEPAAGQGGISRVLKESGKKVESFDIYEHKDDGITVNRRNFLSQHWDVKYSNFRMKLKASDGGIICHPPQHLFKQFIKKALTLTEHHGTVAFWLSHSIDTELCYQEFFHGSDAFYKKIVPIQRLRLSDDTLEPMAWYIWRHGYGGVPTLHYEII
jgi:hypothetical protein